MSTVTSDEASAPLLNSHIQRDEIADRAVGNIFGRNWSLRLEPRSDAMALYLALMQGARAVLS